MGDQGQGRSVFHIIRAVVCAGRPPWSGSRSNGSNPRPGFNLTRAVDFVTPGKIQRQFGVHGAVPVKQQGEPFGLLSNRYHDKGALGQLVARASSKSDWTSLSANSERMVSSVEGLGDSKLNWIETPPGGWVDGDFQDVGESPEEHAYVIYVKVAREGNGIGIVSRPYSVLANQ